MSSNFIFIETASNTQQADSKQLSTDLSYVLIGQIFSEYPKELIKVI